MIGRSIGLIATLLASLAMPIASEAQSAGRMHRIGLLSLQPPSTFRTSPQIAAFFEGLNQLGYVEGKNLAIEVRFSEGKVERLAALAAELVGLSPDVIWVPACGATLDALRHATRTIPIVVATCNDDMVSSGSVASLARPGGNVTGQQKLTPELSVKQLELLKQVEPRATRIAVLWDPGYSGFVADWKALHGAAPRLGVTLLPFEARGPDQWEAVFAAMDSQRADGLITMQDVNSYLYPQRLAELAARVRLPAIYPYHVNANAGGLISYGVNVPDMFRRSATFIDRILKGAKPGDIPVEQPTRLEMVINLKTAKAMGITVPQAVLMRADQVIR